jgi:hypothetical protein
MQVQKSETASYTEHLTLPVAERDTMRARAAAINDSRNDNNVEVRDLTVYDRVLGVA